jgi:hypothetical protein
MWAAFLQEDWGVLVLFCVYLTLQSLTQAFAYAYDTGARERLALLKSAFAASASIPLAKVSCKANCSTEKLVIF